MNRQVRRNIERFPNDFMFQLTREEDETLKCQNGISKQWSGQGPETNHQRLLCSVDSCSSGEAGVEQIAESVYLCEVPVDQ